MNHTANTPRPLAAVCLAAATMLLAMPLWGQQGPLWQTPKGIDAQDETPPGPFDRDAGERRRIGVPLPTMAQPVMQLWYRPRQPLHEARQGQVFAPAAGTPLAEYPATKISLAIAAKPAQLAVEDFGKAAGLTIRGRDAYFLRDSSLPAMNLQFSDAPMLEGLLQMCSQLGTLPTEVIPKRITIAPVEADTGVGKWCVSGRFAVVLQRIENVAEFNNGSGGGFGSSSGGPALSLPTGGHGARMSVLLLAEPGVAVARFPSELDIDTFIDEVDQKIEVGSEPRQPFSNARTAGTLRNLTLPLTLPERPGHTIVLLRGTANVLVAKKVEHIAVDPPAMAVTKQINGMNIEISPLVKQGTNSYQTKVLISRGELDADLWEKASRALDDLHVVVEDLGGQSMQMSQRNERTADSITISGNVFSSSNGTPGQIVLDIPTVLQEVKVPFEFKNLVLP